jgi:hypothetical protein
MRTYSFMVDGWSFYPAPSMQVTGVGDSYSQYVQTGPATIAVRGLVDGEKAVIPLSEQDIVALQASPNMGLKGAVITYYIDILDESESPASALRYIRESLAARYDDNDHGGVWDFDKADLATLTFAAKELDRMKDEIANLTSTNRRLHEMLRESQKEVGTLEDKYEPHPRPGEYWCEDCEDYHDYSEWVRD